MFVISTSMGFVLKFQDKDDMRQHIDNLKNQLNWINKNDIEDPYLYAIFDDAIETEKVQELLEKLKEEHLTRYKEEE